MVHKNVINVNTEAEYKDDGCAFINVTMRLIKYA